jgi:hypothetical protein
VSLINKVPGLTAKEELKENLKAEIQGLRILVTELNAENENLNKRIINVLSTEKENLKLKQ